MKPKTLFFAVVVSLLFLYRHIALAPAKSAVVSDGYLPPQSANITPEKLADAQAINDIRTVIEVHNQAAQTAVSEQQCHDFFASGDSAQSWQQIAKQHTKILVTRLQRLGFTSAQIAQMTKQSGINWVIDEDEAAFEASIRHWSLLNASQKPPKLAVKEVELLQTLISGGDVDELIVALGQGKISTDKTIYRKPVLATILAQVDEVDEYTISGLLDAGLKPSLYDLVVATEQGLSVEAIDQLFFAAGIDATTTWRNGNRYSSLALVAISHSQPELLAFWLNYGAPLNIDKNKLSALDLMVKPKTPQEADIANQVFALLLDNSDKPSISLRPDSDNSWLSQDNQNKYRQWQEGYRAEPHRNLYAEQLQRLNREQKTLAARLANAQHLERHCL